MHIALSNFIRSALSGGLLLSAGLCLSAVGTPGLALAGCGISSYENYGGTHSSTATSGVHTATSSPPAGSTGTPSLPSCPTNATIHSAGAGAPAGHGTVAHVPAGMSHAVKQAATSNGKSNANKPFARTSPAVQTANLKSVKH